jgi:hypothetical protein
VVESAKQQRGLAEVEQLGREQTGAESRNRRPVEPGNEKRRCLQMMIMMSPVVAVAENKERHR